MNNDQPQSQSQTGWQFSGFAFPTTTPVPDQLFDELLHRLSGAELKVLMYIIRRTFGFKKQSDDISLAQLVKGIRTKDGKIFDLCSKARLEKLLAIGVLAFVIAYGFDDIISLMSHSYDLLISTLWISVFFCFFKKDTKKESAIFSVIFGFVAFVFFKIYPLEVVPDVIPSLFVSLVGYLFGPKIYSR